MKKTLIAENVRGCWKGGENILVVQDDGQALMYENKTWISFSLSFDFRNFWVTPSGHFIGAYPMESEYDDNVRIQMQWTCWFKQKQIWSICLDNIRPVMNVVGDKCHIWSLVDGKLIRYVVCIDTGIVDHKTIHDMNNIPIPLYHPLIQYYAMNMNDQFFVIGAGEDDDTLLYRTMDDGTLVPFMSDFPRSHMIQRVVLGRHIHIFCLNNDDEISLMAVRIKDKKILWEKSDHPIVAMDDRERYVVTSSWNVMEGIHLTMYEVSSGQRIWEQDMDDYDSIIIYFFKDSTELLVVKRNHKAYSIPLFASQKMALQSLLIGSKMCASLQRVLRSHLFVF